MAGDTERHKVLGRVHKGFLPTLKTRSLDRITMSDIEHAMRQMREAGLSDKSIRNYVGVISALFNYAIDRRRRWAARNPAADVDLPKIPNYSELRYLTTDELWLLVDSALPGRHQELDTQPAPTPTQLGAPTEPRRPTPDLVRVPPS